MFKLEFDPANKPLAAAIGRALTEYAGGIAVRGESHSAAGIAQAAEAPDTPPTVSDDMAAVQEYNESEAVKLQDSVAGHSESQSQTPVGEQTHVQETAQHGAGDAPSVDKNGVPFDVRYCAKAAKPFYASGKTAGQWKKGTKVEQSAYDDWYASALANVTPAAAAEEFDTAQAFGGASPETPAAETPVPSGIGPFIMWTSEQQTAGHLTQPDINAAYASIGLTQADIMPNNPNAQANIAAVFGVLSAKVPA